MSEIAREFIAKLYDLNEAVYTSYARLNQEREQIGNPKMIEAIRNNIFTLYKAEWQRLYTEYQVETLPKLWEAESNYGGKVPRRILWFWRNEPAKLIENRIEAELERYYRDKQAVIDRLTAALEAEDNADQPPEYD